MNRPYFFPPDYIIFLVFTAVGTGILAALLLISRLIHPYPSKPTPDKLLPYECGNIPIGKPWIQFRIPYYVFALIFVIFDATFVFLFPWAIVLKEFGIEVFLAGIVFLCFISLGLIYAGRKGMLKWI